MESIGSSKRGAGGSRIRLWQKRFRDFSRRGCTVDEFCRQLGVTTATFYYWRRKVAEAADPSGAVVSAASSSRTPSSSKSSGCEGAPKTSGSFIPVKLQPSMVVGSEVAICLPSGAQVRIPVSAPEVIAAVVAQVRELSADSGAA